MAILNEKGLERLWSHIIAKLGGKVDKEEGMGLSSNNFTSEEKDKLAGIAEGATNVTVDGELDGASSNPVENRVLYDAISRLATIEYVDEMVGNMESNTQNSFTLVDEVNGNTYRISIRNGILVSAIAIETIEIAQEPYQMIYYVGQYFDPEGMAVLGYTFSEEQVDITDYTYSTEPLTLNDTEFKITYTQGGDAITTDLILTIYEDFDPERDLIDFIYETVDNGDGTYSYSLIEWRGTYLGEPSTKMVIPNHCSVIIPSN